MRITDRHSLITALTEAAELEHAVMCQYLFAAFSLKQHPEEGGVTWEQLEHVREWKATILLVARQEMEHLGLVCNLLTSVGGVPHFGHSGFPTSAGCCPELGSLTLEPFSRSAIERFMEIEKAHEMEGPIGRVYRGIREGFQMLCAPGGHLFTGPPEGQVTNASLDLRPGLFDINLQPVDEIRSAAAVLDHITESGDGSGNDQPSHYERFADILIDFWRAGEQDAAFVPVRPVVTNPRLKPAQHPSAVIEHPITRRAAGLFEMAYDIMLRMLLRFYAPVEETPEERNALQQVVFFPMMTIVLRPLGEMLTCMPAYSSGSALRAGAVFACAGNLGLHPRKESAWIYLHERLTAMVGESAELLEAIRVSGEPWAARLSPRVQFLHENLLCLDTSFERRTNLPEMQRKQLLKKLFDAG